MQANAVGLGLALVVAKDERDLDLAGAQHVEGLGRMRIGEADSQAGMLAGQQADRLRQQRADRGGEAGQSYVAGVEPDVGGQLGVGGIDASDDLGGRSARSRPASVSRMPRPTRCSSCAPVSASSRARW